MPALAHLEVRAAGHGGARVDEIGRLEQARTRLALVAARLIVTAFGASTYDVTIGQKAVIAGRIDLLCHPFLEETMKIGTLFATQALLLTRHMRGDVDGYPPFIWR